MTDLNEQLKNWHDELNRAIAETENSIADSNRRLERLQKRLSEVKDLQHFVNYNGIPRNIKKSISECLKWNPATKS